MKLAFDPSSGRVRLVLPQRAAIRAALVWVEEHRDWIEAQRAKLPAARPFVPGAVVPFGGVDHVLDWQLSAPRTPRVVGDHIVVGGPADGLDQRITRWLKREAAALLAEETRHYAARAGVGVTRVGVGDTSSRWGSCSSSGTIRYSWRLILAPAWVRRATVAHEVAHRVHMNHSPAFHALVAQLYEADPTPARRWLRANGAALHWYGRSPS
ncbi:M48 family metallopeptidase [Sphingomonas donggukensis]|uniref:M48 family metallopeptidase n=1 Tax=Sphingomonas donggukensis TaxID=2949093 RepID=A0ABY4TXA5_9SPHN|nr:YgjP-like metallopeptidase domain-containing protein [Sphingomonas donggukensis]URW77040.1 M48 family metallopeptidase [Sphingomonas donggukensis]